MGAFVRNRVNIFLIWNFSKFEVILTIFSLATGMVNSVVTSEKIPKGVILEAPFDNMPSEILVHPFGTVS